MVFADSLDSIKDDLLKIISDIVRCSHGFPRPENTLARRDKNTIWKVPFEDELVCRIETEIETIININNNNINKVLDVYNEFKSLLNEQEKLNEFIGDSSRTR